MDGFRVLEVLNTYPTPLEDVYSGLWPSGDEWDRETGGAYAPWKWTSRELSSKDASWSGPAVFVADMSPACTRSDTLNSGTIWFELSDDLHLRRWGHTLGDEVRFYPQAEEPAQ